MERPLSGRVLVLTVLLVTAGCLSGAPGAGTATQSATATPSVTEDASTRSPGTDAPTTFSDGHWQAANRAEANHSVAVANAWNETVPVTVTVVRDATNETVHAGTYDVAAGAERVVYDTARVNPDGIESFRITVTARNQTDSLSIETNGCYGDVFGEIQADGSLYLYYSIC